MADQIRVQSSVLDLLGGWLGDEPPPVGRLARLLPTSGTLPGFPGRSIQASPVIALVALLRSLGQVIFINNPVSGLLLLLALLLQSLPMAAFTLIGIAAANLLARALGRRLHSATGLPPLTLPFCVVTWLALALVKAAGHPSLQLVDPGALPPAGGALQTLLLAVPRGFGQVFLLPGLASGLLVLAAVAVASPLAALVGLLGAAAGAGSG